ncbi:Fe-S cluster-binding ribosome biosynthesis protein [Dimargaris cristalligena]|nr:Fe-S cluster-binding ribosome biosynthesis protein [Dimargaris cristalligena]
MSELQLQCVTVALIPSRPAEIQKIGESSAYMDSEQCIVAAKGIKRFILHANRTAFIVEHDFAMIPYLADCAVVYGDTPSFEVTAKSPSSCSLV